MADGEVPENRLSLKEVASAMGVTQSAVNGWVYRGIQVSKNRRVVLGAELVGGRYLVTESALESFRKSLRSKVEARRRKLQKERAKKKRLKDREDGVSQ